MLKNIFVVFLCFSLLFIAFHPDFLKEHSIFDTLDGHKQVFFDGFPLENCSLDDFLVTPGALYVCTSEGTPGEFEIVSSGIEISNSIFCYINDIENEVPGVFGASSFADDSKLEFWYGSSDPLINMSKHEKLDHYCDIWFDTEFDRCYVFDGYLWHLTSNEFVNSSHVGVSSYNDVFSFGYELTIGSFEVVTSIFKGPNVLFARFEQWRDTLFGDVKLFDFIFKWISTIVDNLNKIAESLPVIGPLKRFVDNILAPFESIFKDILEWAKEKIK